MLTIFCLLEGGCEMKLDPVTKKQNGIMDVSQWKKKTNQIKQCLSGEKK